MLAPRVSLPRRAASRAAVATASRRATKIFESTLSHLAVRGGQRGQGRNSAIGIFSLLGRIPTLAQAPMPGRWCGRGGGFNAGNPDIGAGFYAGRARCRSHVGQAIGRASTHWASPYSLGGPWASPLGEPVLRGRWASHSTTFTVASTFTVAHNACACLALSYGACSAPGARSACSVPARHWHSYGARSAP